MEKGLREGKFVEGLLRVNPKNPNMAFVDLGAKKKVGERDPVIPSGPGRNRAIHGDRVVCRVWDPDAEDEASS